MRTFTGWTWANACFLLWRRTISEIALTQRLKLCLLKFKSRIHGVTGRHLCGLGCMSLPSGFFVSVVKFSQVAATKRRRPNRGLYLTEGSIILTFSSAVPTRFGHWYSSLSRSGGHISTSSCTTSRPSVQDSFPETISKSPVLCKVGQLITTSALACSTISTSR